MQIPFVLGLLVGAVVATAWAQVPVSPGPDPSGHAAIVNPIDMMVNAQLLPVEAYDAF
jgi:hypothetical protein